ncbi:Ig-like domain-containing protein [Verminephrobacter aporrectodeae]|uniref:Ig-like domain-containing protein n=1 Tax=Verminephrobacter aporrectodeae TaxID=1110389 RepID=UPI0022390E08|nr:Ig-like domain-containing protein [Verminephrobacter aporrectodeae]
MGETTLVTFDFNQVVTGFDADDIVLTHANGTLGVLTAGANGKTWTAPFTPAANTREREQHHPRGPDWRAQRRRHPRDRSATSANYSVDTWPADHHRSNRHHHAGRRPLGRGGSTTVTFAFNEVVTGFTRDDVELYEANGTLGDLTTHDDGRTWTATFTPKANARAGPTPSA